MHISITCGTDKECLDELNGQLNDGFFENCRYGEVVEVIGQEEIPMVGLNGLHIDAE